MMEASAKARIAQMRILESQKKMERGLELVERLHTLSFGQIKNLITTYVPSSRRKGILLRLVMASHAKGTLQNELEELETQLRIEMSKKFELMDSLTALGATTVPDENARYESFNLYNPDLLVANFGDGTARSFGHISGVPNTGKTNLGCLLIEQWAMKGRSSLGNIKMIHDDGMPTNVDYAYVGQVSAVLKVGAQLRLRNRPWLFINDEAGLTYLKSEAMTKRNRQQDKLARIIGKLGGNEVLIEQRAESVPTIIQDFARNVYHCPSVPGRAILQFKGPDVRLYKRIKDLPRTDLPYDAKDIAWLAFDIDVEKLFEYVSKTEGGSRDQAKRILQFLEGDRLEALTTDQTKDEVRRHYRGNGGKYTERELASIYKKSPSTIHRWLSET